jgi:hypothetical protein
MKAAPTALYFSTASIAHDFNVDSMRVVTASFYSTALILSTQHTLRWIALLSGQVHAIYPLRQACKRNYSRQDVLAGATNVYSHRRSTKQDSTCAVYQREISKWMEEKEFDQSTIFRQTEQFHSMTSQLTKNAFILHFCNSLNNIYGGDATFKEETV